MPTYITHSREETVALGKRAAAVLPAGSLICFTGGLGAGKTAFCEGLAQGLGCIDEALGSDGCSVHSHVLPTVSRCTRHERGGADAHRGHVPTHVAHV